jgi:hypothetical protein
MPVIPLARRRPLLRVLSLLLLLLALEGSSALAASTAGPPRGGEATLIGDTVGDPFKDTSSVAMNPIIKFTTLFGLLAVELAVTLSAARGPGLRLLLAWAFLGATLFFVRQSFYAMRIQPGPGVTPAIVAAAPVRGE